jgi:hypothetical protein
LSQVGNNKRVNALVLSEASFNRDLKSMDAAHLWNAIDNSIELVNLAQGQMGSCLVQIFCLLKPI